MGTPCVWRSPLEKQLKIDLAHASVQPGARYGLAGLVGIGIPSALRCAKPPTAYACAGPGLLRFGSPGRWCSWRGQTQPHAYCYASPDALGICRLLRMRRRQCTDARERLPSAIPINHSRILPLCWCTDAHVAHRIVSRIGWRMLLRCTVLPSAIDDKRLLVSLRSVSQVHRRPVLRAIGPTQLHACERSSEEFNP